MSTSGKRSSKRPGGRRSNLRLKITPIPKPLFGINLRAELGSEWAKLRRSLLAAHGPNCQTCGVSLGTPSKVQAHEEWSYEETADPACATIGRIALQCEKCHGVEHFLRMLTLGSRKAVSDAAIMGLISHFYAVNHVGDDEFIEHLSATTVKWAQRSELRWRADLRPYADRQIEVDADPLIAAEGRSFEKPFNNVAGKMRPSEFLNSLTKLSSASGLWLDCPSESKGIPLVVCEPGQEPGRYGATSSFGNDAKAQLLSGFLAALAEISRRCGYWIRNSAQSDEVRLEFRVPGKRAAQYALTRRVTVRNGSLGITEVLSVSSQVRKRRSTERP
jgi:hypothetical protein